MSTNFYFTPSQGPLTAFGQLHLGKRSGGSQFSFQAYVDEGGKRHVRVGSADLTVEVDVPRIVVRSWADWQALLNATPGEITNEYGTTYTLAAFEQEIAEHSPKVKGLRCPHDAKLASEAQFGKVDPEQNWKDAEGFSFSAYEFF